MSDPFDLGRYVDAQDAGGTHDQALAERSGARVLRLEGGRLHEPGRAAA